MPELQLGKVAIDVTPQNCPYATCPQPLLVHATVPDHNPFAHGWMLYYSMN